MVQATPLLTQNLSVSPELTLRFPIAVKAIIHQDGDCHWLKTVPPKDVFKCEPPGPINVTLDGNSIDADAIRLRILRYSHPGFMVGPKSNYWNPPYRKEGDLWKRERHRGEKAIKRGSQRLELHTPKSRNS